jgi:hypothetical protein
MRAPGRGRASARSPVIISALKHPRTREQGRKISSCAQCAPAGAEEMRLVRERRTPALARPDARARERDLQS